MQATCPQCQQSIPLADVNVATDIALCRHCEQNFALSEIVEEQLNAPTALNQPPKGSWFQPTMNGFQVGASTRSPQAFILVPFICVWSGITLGGAYGTQIASGEFNPWISLFGLPFLAGTFFLGSQALMLICGKVVVEVQGNQGVIFTGVGQIGWRRRFTWNEVTAFHITPSYRNRQNTEQLTLYGAKELNFASGLTKPRLNFLLGTLRHMLSQSKRLRK